jgi:tetratricopeptide (TPR) repeat protein
MGEMTFMFKYLFNSKLTGALMKKAVLIFLVIAMLTGLSDAATDPLKRGMQLYKKHHYEDAIQLLYTYLPSAESNHQAKTLLGLGMICLANARLYQNLYQASLETNLDYFNRLLSIKGPAGSHLANLYLGLTLLEAGRLSEAAGCFEKFIADKDARAPDKELAKISLATALFLADKHAQANNLWSQVNLNHPGLSTSLAAAYSRVGLTEKKPLAACQKALDRLRQADQAPSIQIINDLIYVYAKAGRIDEGFELIMSADPTAFFHEEVPTKNKVIRFYNSSLLKNLSFFYAKAALKFLEKAHASPDRKISSMAQYYLGEGYELYGDHDQCLQMLNAYIATPNNPSGLKQSARVRQSFNQYLLGQDAAVNEQLRALLQSEPDPNLMADMLLACIQYKFDVPQIVGQASAMAQQGQGKPFNRINFALGKYYLWKQNYARAVVYMEAGRDKSNKNRIEFNDPLMLVDLAQAYLRSKQFSEALEIFFEMSKQFPAVRQIQVALQGVYIMEQKSAGDVKIF